MKLRILIALLVMLSMPLSAHSQDAWSFFTKHKTEDAGWKAHRKSIIKQSVLFGKLNFSGLSSKVIAERTALILDTWHKYRKTKLKNIKSPEVVVALAWSESSMDSSSVSKTHDKGLMQVSLPTAKEICALYGLKFDHKTADYDLRFDNAFNVMVGLCEFDYALRKCKGKTDLAVLTYKLGFGRLSYLLKHNKLTAHYIRLYSTVNHCSTFLTKTAQPQVSIPNNVESKPSLIFAGNGPLNLLS